MKIVHIVPGSGGSFYCQNCLRDNALVKALRALGHDVIMIPLYLPLFADDSASLASAPVFYGAINVWLKEKVPLLRRMPAWMDRLLNAPPLLQWAAGKAGATRATGLEAMTLSLLRGENGNQAEELNRLVVWLKREIKPDVVHLSNALLLGLARRIKQELGTKMVCTLQDEDVWLDSMEAVQSRQAWQILSERAAEVDRFVAVSHYYARVMREKMRLPPARLSVVRIGIELAGRQPSALPFDPPVLGYLSRMSDALGLGLLVDAFLLLRQQARFQRLKLRIAGGCTQDDRPFIQSLHAKLAAHLAQDSVAFLPEFDPRKRGEFLQSLTLLSVPILQGEAFGTFQIEAMAAGVPVVQPNLGAFPEIIEATGGGVIYEPNNPAKLAVALSTLLDQPDYVRRLGQQGRASVLSQFSIERMARETAQVYEAIMQEGSTTAIAETP